MSDTKLTQRLNFLNKTVRVTRENFVAQGTVYYFNETALILEVNGRDYEVINLQNFDDFTIDVIEPSEETDLSTILNKETLSPSEILPKIME